MRPAEITGLLRSRRSSPACVASRTRRRADRTRTGPTEISEYHWSILMTGNRFADVMPTALRLFLRRPSNVPDAVVRDLALRMDRASGAPAGDPRTVRRRVRAQHGRPGVDHRLDHQRRHFGLLVRPVPHGGAGVGEQDHALHSSTSPATWTRRRTPMRHAAPFGRHGRPAACAARRPVLAHRRGGPRRRRLHRVRRADRVLGADARTARRTAANHSRPRALHLDDFADRSPTAPTALDDFQDLQFTLWQDLRWQGNPWRITDFVTVGTPMALADLLVTRPPLFSGFKKSDGTLRTRTVRRTGSSRRTGPLPARTDLPVDSDDTSGEYRGRSGARRSRSQSLRGHALDEPVVSGDSRRTARRLVRRRVGSAVRPGHPRHRRYRATSPNGSNAGRRTPNTSRHPDKDDEGDVAWHLRRTLALQTHAVLQRLLRAPLPEPGALAVRGSNRRVTSPQAGALPGYRRSSLPIELRGCDFVAATQHI